MLYFSRAKAAAILLTALVVCGFTVPNFFPEPTVKSWPAWAQRRLVLGLHLPGDSDLPLDRHPHYDKKEKLDQIRDYVRPPPPHAKIGYTGLAVRDDAADVPRSRHNDL